MSLRQIRPKESTLQYLWANLVFAQKKLRTESGDILEIFDPGELNHSDGPDFLNAKIKIGKLIHYGAIEIHWNSKDWFAHKHHLDRKYDNVVLHVVAEDRSVTPVYTASGFKLPALNVYHQIPANFQSFLQNNSNSTLPCAGLITSISQEVFDRQVEKAQQEYLEQKVSNFFQHFNESAVMSEAWKNALFISLCDGLGVPSNREAMIDTAKKIIDHHSSGSHEMALKTEKIYAQLSWNLKGVRDSTNPIFRINQALNIFQFISLRPLEYFFNINLEIIWDELLQVANMKPTAHNKRLYVSFFLPAMYGLGTIFHSSKLMEQVLVEWKNSKIEVPRSIHKRFGIFAKKSHPDTMKRIGLVHQFKSYCSMKQCSKCEVLNKAISS
jgi:hypothetical protein